MKQLLLEDTYYPRPNLTPFRSAADQIAGVVYKPWSSVGLDLSGYIGQNVTLRFTTYDCALGGHFGYAYIDGSCLQFNAVVNDNVCSNASKILNGIPTSNCF